MYIQKLERITFEDLRLLSVNLKMASGSQECERAAFHSQKEKNRLKVQCPQNQF